MQIQNNGRAFTEEDWTRIRKIAEGNPNSDACGMFGVGFYSVFAMCEQPIIKSGTCNTSPREWWVMS
jgi:HSP90 family molecular chaperone